MPAAPGRCPHFQEQATMALKGEQVLLLRATPLARILDKYWLRCGITNSDQIARASGNLRWKPQRIELTPAAGGRESALRGSTRIGGACVRVRDIMTNPVASTPDTYRAYAEECWKLADDAAEIETKAAFELTAKAWTMLATQVQAREAAVTHSILETAA